MTSPPDPEAAGAQGWVAEADTVLSLRAGSRQGSRPHDLRAGVRGAPWVEIPSLEIFFFNTLFLSFLALNTI